MASSYSEDKLVEEPAISLLALTLNNPCSKENSLSNTRLSGYTKHINKEPEERIARHLP